MSASPGIALLHHVSLGSGPPLFVLGGIHLDHRYLRPWLDPLAANVEVVYLDPRGVGRSATPPAGTGNGASAPAGRDGQELAGVDHGTWADDVVALADRLGHRRFRLLGHSYGGFLALEIALRYPDRIGGLALCATAASLAHVDLALENARQRGTTEQVATLSRVLAGPVGDDRTFRDAWLDVLPLYFHRWRPAHREVFAERVTYSAAAYDRAYFSCLPGFDLAGSLEEIDVPVLVVSGRHDWIMPPEVAGGPLADGLGAEHAVFERSGHFPFIEEPDAFVDRTGGWLAGEGR